MRVFARVLLAVLLFQFAGLAPAHRPSVQECREAADFIRNAALSRENGMARGIFFTRLQDDLMSLRSHPPALRWFAQDEDDEAFLLAQTRHVFDAPILPDEHAAQALRSCLARLSAGVI